MFLKRLQRRKNGRDGAWVWQPAYAGGELTRLAR